MAPLMALHSPSGTGSRHRPARAPVDADRYACRRPSLRFVAPSALPPWRVHFPEPDPRSGVRSGTPRPSSLPPEGGSPAAGRQAGARPRPLPDSRRIGCRRGRFGEPEGVHSRMNGCRAAVHRRTVVRPPGTWINAERQVLAFHRGPRSRPSRGRCSRGFRDRDPVHRAGGAHTASGTEIPSIARAVLTRLPGPRSRPSCGR
jgi:hypothetical protein